MTEHNEESHERFDDQIAFLPDQSYVIPARLLKQLVEAASPAPEPTARALLIRFLQAARIEYGYEDTICPDPTISQVWFRLPEGWELVFEFNSSTGEFQGLSLGE